MAATLEPTDFKDATVQMEEKEGLREIALDPAAEKKLVRKCDLHVVPMLFVLFLLAFLDRTNIGNAKIQGMIEDLNMTGPSDYNIALFIFFIPYILFEGESSPIDLLSDECLTDSSALEHYHQTCGPFDLAECHHVLLGRSDDWTRRREDKRPIDSLSFPCRTFRGRAVSWYSRNYLHPIWAF